MRNDTRICLDDAERVIEMYNKAAEKFIQKCEDGRARSTETLADLKQAREAARKLGWE